MRSRAALFLLLVAATYTARTHAQAAAPSHAPDFRAQRRIAPLVFPAKPGAPFMAVAHTTWVATLPDGSTVTSENARVVARDNDGRVFQERRTFVPVPNPKNLRSIAYASEYIDPVAHVVYRCGTVQKVCNEFGYFRMPDLPRRTGLQPDGTTYLTRENLGRDTFAGQDVIHTRETLTLYRASVGNTNTILRTVEYWYSPALGVNLQVKRHDPRDGDQTLWLSDLSLSAASPDVFQLPTGYRIIDHRGRPATAGQQP
ncbi:MAG: hypothetical protein ACLGSH_08335 [Acidobacteriota bacterium]